MLLSNIVNNISFNQIMSGGLSTLASGATIYHMANNVNNNDTKDKLYRMSNTMHKFILQIDLGPEDPQLRDGLQFNSDNQLLDGELQQPDSPSLHQYLNNSILQNNKIATARLLTYILMIYFYQHNTIAYATNNKDKAPTQWNINNFAVTQTFYNTFNKDIPVNKLHNMTYIDIEKFVTKHLIDDKTINPDIRFKEVCDKVKHSYLTNKSNWDNLKI